MTLTPLDWIVIAVYFLFNVGIGLYYARRAVGSTSEFFLSGRNPHGIGQGRNPLASVRHPRPRQPDGSDRAGWSWSAHRLEWTTSFTSGDAVAAPHYQRRPGRGTRNWSIHRFVTAS